MVWCLVPADPLSDEIEYFIFTKGTYKVGRKGCDVIVTKDKGVSRIHAYIVVDDMSSWSSRQTSSYLHSRVQIRDCSKYGTFINKNTVSKELKVHELPNKEASLKDGDLVSFGTGSATYRFSFVSLIFFLHCSESFTGNHPIEEKISSIGAHITYHFSEECTHVLVDDFMPVGEAVIDAVVAKKPIVLWSWVELIAEQGIGKEIPSWSSYMPTLTFEGVPVKIGDLTTRAKCLEGYTCLLQSIDEYKFRSTLQSLLEVVGAKILFIEELCSSGQGLGYGESSRLLGVIPSGSGDKFGCFSKVGSLYRVNEVDLVRGVLSGQLQTSTLVSLSAPVSSSCSTDETIVADSDEEAQTATSVHANIDSYKNEAPEYVGKPEISVISLPSRLEDSHAVSSTVHNDGMTKRREKFDESASGNSDIFYTQDLIVRDLKLPSIINSTPSSGVLNFKRFKKENALSGNSFNNLIPFAKFPYNDSDFRNQDMLKSVKEEKRRKHMEAVAEDLFNNEKTRKRGVAGSIHGLLTRA